MCVNDNIIYCLLLQDEATNQHFDRRTELLYGTLSAFYLQQNYTAMLPLNNTKAGQRFRFCTQLSHLYSISQTSAPAVQETFRTVNASLPRLLHRQGSALLFGHWERGEHFPAIGPALDYLS